MRNSERVRFPNIATIGGTNDYRNDKKMFEEFSARFLELYPGAPITLICCDTNLKNLGFTTDAPCTFELNMPEDDLLNTLDDLRQIEVDAFNTEDGHPPPSNDPYYLKYVKYGWLADFLFDAMEKED